MSYVSWHRVRINLVSILIAVIMNNSLKHLYQIGTKDSRIIIGLMSGTSLDGLDIACCRISDSGTRTSVSVVAFETIDYTEEVKQHIRKVFAKPQVDFPFLVMLNEWIGQLHGQMINDFLEKHAIEKKNIDAIASHGQTVMHVPKHQHKMEGFPNATLQIGDGDHIAVTTGIITLSDFRQKHLAAGGEGAPLAVYGDYLIFSKNGEDRIMLNMGGIGNFTYLPGDTDASKVFVTDSGPGNTLMDAFMLKHFGQPYDRDAIVARKGKVNNQLLDTLKAHYFFKLPFPKTTGPEVFNLGLIDEASNKCGLSNLSHVDVMATLNQLSAETITEAIRSVISQHPYHIYMSGGGAHNPLLVETMSSLLPNCHFGLSDALGIPGDAKEAVLFAVLANESLAGNPILFGQKLGVPSVCMGKISLPS